MPDDFIIRQAVGADAPAIADVHIRSWQWAYRGQLPDEYLDGLSATLERRAAFFRPHVERPWPEHRYWVAAQGEQVVGFAITWPSRDDDGALSTTTAVVSLIYLLQEAAGKGIGRALFGHVVEDLRARGFRQATLWVLETNTRARRFFEAAGWLPDGARRTVEGSDVVLHDIRYQTTL
jgi:ribosomal protein S18 acetylase RimI-like enzyme